VIVNAVLVSPKRTLASAIPGAPEKSAADGPTLTGLSLPEKQLIFQCSNFRADFEAIDPESGDSRSPARGLFYFWGGKQVYLDTLRIFNTHNNLSPRPGLPKYLEIRGSGIFNGTENGTEINLRRSGLLILPALFVLTDCHIFCLR
jgi:hypothetical protein